jgi:hypothetical protein
MLSAIIFRTNFPPIRRLLVFKEPVSCDSTLPEKMFLRDEFLRRSLAGWW